MNLNSKIKELAHKKNAVILAHYYQIPDIQEIADFIGDSLFLAQKAAETDADIIVFCGVHFMAETAKILNPSKKVLLPDMEAGCSLADSCNPDELRAWKQQHPDYKIISYINCSAEVKTLSDIICTSGNALKIVNRFPEDTKIMFAPDRNLGGYINRVTGRNMELWNGACHVHDQLNAENVLILKQQHPKALIIAHPECNPAVLAVADYIGSTAGMLDFVKKSSNNQFIVATETGIIHQMKKMCPDKEFFVVATDTECACNDCSYMKLNTLEKLYNTLLTEQPEIILDEELINKAKQPIVDMLKLS